MGGFSLVWNRWNGAMLFIYTHTHTFHVYYLTGKQFSSRHDVLSTGAHKVVCLDTYMHFYCLLYRWIGCCCCCMFLLFVLNYSILVDFHRFHILMFRLTCLSLVHRVYSSTTNIIIIIIMFLVRFFFSYTSCFQFNCVCFFSVYKLLHWILTIIFYLSLFFLIIYFILCLFVCVFLIFCFVFFF